MLRRVSTYFNLVEQGISFIVPRTSLYLKWFVFSRFHFVYCFLA